MTTNDKTRSFAEEVDHIEVEVAAGRMSAMACFTKMRYMVATLASTPTEAAVQPPVAAVPEGSRLPTYGGPIVTTDDPDLLARIEAAKTRPERHGSARWWLQAALKAFAWDADQAECAWLALDTEREVLATKSGQARPEEAVGALFQQSETGRTRVVMRDQIADCDAQWFKVGDLVFTATPTPAPAAWRDHDRTGMRYPEESDLIGGETDMPAPAAQGEARSLASLAATLRAMAHNYTHRHYWDHLDADTCQQAANELESARGEAQDDVLEALDLSPDTFRTEGGFINKGKLRAAILHPYNYLPPDHWLQARFSKPGGRPTAAPERAEVRPPVLADGIELATQWVQKRLDDFVERCGATDPSTGALEFGRGPHADAKHEYVGELMEIIEGIRALGITKPAEACPLVPLSEGEFSELFGGSIFEDHTVGTFDAGMSLMRLAITKFCEVNGITPPSEADSAQGEKPPSNCGHGHVFPNPNGVRARCGGPGFCALCSKDAAQKANRAQGGATTGVSNAD